MIHDQQLQHTINLANEHGDEEAMRMLGLNKQDTLRRYKDEAKKRGLSPYEEKIRMPKILLLDIETSLMRFYAWSCGKTYLGPSQIETDWHMLGWAVKWLFDTEITSDVLTPEEGRNHNDERITQSIWQYLDEADIVIAHNALGFDIPKIMARVISHQIQPLSPFQVIDTLQASRSIARFSSNKQDELAKQFGLRRKVEHEGFNLWIRCFDGDPEALLKMEEYNRGDTIGLEDLYLYLRPYMKNHPNIALYMDTKADACYKCGSIDLSWPEGKFYYTNVNKYPVYQCNNPKCLSMGRSRFSAMTKDDRKHITSPIAR